MVYRGMINHVPVAVKVFNKVSPHYMLAADIVS